MGACCSVPPSSPTHLWTIPLTNVYSSYQASNESMLKTELHEVQYESKQRQWYQSVGFLQTFLFIYKRELPLFHLVPFNTHTDKTKGVVKQLIQSKGVIGTAHPQGVAGTAQPSKMIMEVDGENHLFAASNYVPEVYFVLTNKALLCLKPQNEFLSILNNQKRQLKVLCCCISRIKKRLPLVLLKLVSSFFFI